ncbi:MAG: TonB-dependent receptor plug domain-containing protein [Steroidobacteraceae bacterium]
MRAGTQTLLAGSLAAMTMQAGATTPDEPLQPPLPTVVVTSVAPQSPLTFVTDPKLPRQPVPASDGADYPATIPGFTAIRNGGTNGDPVLRGMFGSRLNLLTNEGLMPGACPARMDNAMSYVSPETYDRLVVTKGPQTVQWGPGASAGTVRFERRPQDSVHEHPGLRMNANAITGSNDRNDQLLGVLAARRRPGHQSLQGRRLRGRLRAGGSGALEQVERRCRAGLDPCTGRPGGTVRRRR